MRRHKQILHFDDINQLHEATGFTGRTDLPNIHVLSMEETYPSTRQAMPPYSRRFYGISFYENAHDAVIEINAERVGNLSNMVSFKAPGHVSGWVRGAAQSGFIVLFQPELLNHHPIPLIEDFPFFNPTEINVLPLRPDGTHALREYFTLLHRTFTYQHSQRVPMLQALLLVLLFESKRLYEEYRSHIASKPAKPVLAARFQQLLEQQYLTRQSVQDYAELLNVTPNHLSHAVSNALGRTAHHVIADRILLEAKRLLRYTDLTIAEVAAHLGFAEATHFGRFFKQRLAQTPSEYRRHANDAETGLHES